MKKPNSEVRPIETLKGWDKNPRSITDRDFERLKAQIKKLGVYKPLIINEDNVVLGGNMRLKALTELGEKEVWVSVVKAKTEAEKLEYALSDNDRAGAYVEEELAELLSNFPLQGDMYAADLGEAVLISDVIAMFGPVSGEDGGGLGEDGATVLTIVPPEAPRLKEHIVFRCNSKEQYDKLKTIFGDSPDIKQLTDLLNDETL